MAGIKFMKSGGAAALAAGLALIALPAAAQEREHGGWHGGGGQGGAQGGQGGGGWQARGDGGRAAAAQAAPAPTPAPVPQAQPQPQRNWSRGQAEGGTRWNGNGGGNWSGGNRGGGGENWRARGGYQAPAQSVPQGQVQAERRGYTGNGNAQWQGRNRSYVDPSRNGSYRDTARDNYRGREGGWRGDRDGNNRSWNRDWRGDNHYDWRSYRNANRSVYRLSPYYAPYRDYSYRRLGVGIYLEPLFFGSRYWIDDPSAYRLPPADGGYRWVRYYDDAVLVDTYSGEVVDVIYDFFW